MTTANETPRTPTYSAFSGDKLVASGELSAVISHVKEQAERGKARDVLFFDDRDGSQVDFDLRGTLEEVLKRAIPEAPPQGRGRPKLGVTSREVTLLPRHWEWLERQPRGISGALRRLVEEASKRSPDEEIQRHAREAAHRFMTAMAGDRPGYEEALRSLYAKDRQGFEQRIERWPADVRKHTLELAKSSF